MFGDGKQSKSTGVVLLEIFLSIGKTLLVGQLSRKLVTSCSEDGEFPLLWDISEHI
jgi:hypothetical protein